MLGANEIQSVATFAPNRDEIQTLSISSTAIAEVQVIVVQQATGGSFFLELDTTAQGGSLQYSGYISNAALPSGSSDGTDVQSIINAMSNIFGGVVTVTRSYLPLSSIDYEYVVTFPIAMGDVPQLIVQDAQLTSSDPAYPANITITTTVTGNAVQGYFRIGFQGSTTSNLAWNANEYDVQMALQSLPLIGPLQVSRSSPSAQQTYSWDVTFISPLNSGYQPAFTVDTTSLTTSNTMGMARVWSNVTVFGGNQIGGSFRVGYKGSYTIPIPYNASEVVFENALEQMPGGVVPMDTISVSRLGPDGQQGFIWIVTFLSDLNHTFFGNLPLFTTDGSLLTGTNVSVVATKVRPGTVQEQQLLSVTSVGVVPLNATAVFSYRGSTTEPVRLRPTNRSCNTQIMELQTVSTSTVDTTISGGDDDVSMYLQFKLSLFDYTTNWIQANPNGNGDCALVATAISQELNLWNIFEEVNIKFSQRNSSVYGYQACLWTIQFSSSIGDFPQLRVQATNILSWSLSNFSDSATAGDDTINVQTVVNGQKDAIANALESLPNIGSVTVTALSATQNALDLIQIDSSDMAGTAVTAVVVKCTTGIAPPFNSGDMLTGSPLGSATIIDVLNSSYTITGLDQGVAYYVRVAASNSQGMSNYGFPSVPFVVPMPQQPGVVSNPVLSQIDSTTLAVTFLPPALDGGEIINNYRIEYSLTPFEAEIQRLDLSCPVIDEVQTITTSTSHNLPEVQLVYIGTTYDGTLRTEVQAVVCDASGGSFRLNFGGYTTLPIKYNANLLEIQASLEQLPIINSVNISFTNQVTTACFSRYIYPNGSFEVAFTSVVGMSGNLPLMTSFTNSLSGLRYVSISEIVRGSSPIGGTFKLAFRGYTTTAISVNVSDPVAAETIFAHALGDLDSIPYNGVSVDLVTASALTNYYSQLWRITFTSPELGGNVEALEVVEFYNELTGSDVTINVLTDGQETSSQRGGASEEYASVAGNQIGGYFTLSYRGHTTPPIDVTASDSSVQLMLEELENVGSVRVSRSNPTVWNEFVWTITFISNPGDYPAGSGALLSFSVNTMVASTQTATITGVNSSVYVNIVVKGSSPISGTFQLTSSVTNNSQLVSYSTPDIPADASSSELEYYINLLPNLGSVLVSRILTRYGYTWLVTFNGCKVVGNIDICNEGSINLLEVNSSALSCGNISVLEIERGSGPGQCGNNLCVGYLTEFDEVPLTYTLSGLNTGFAYYVQLRARNSLGYGLPIATDPDSLIPTYNLPSALIPPRLLSSTASSITVNWDPPYDNGGTDIIGYELWIDDWAGGHPRMVFDGTGQPLVTSFTVSGATSYGVESGRSYRFTVRALNYCLTSQPSTVCRGSFSNASIYTARSPRVPLPPPMPYRSAKSNIGSPINGDASITIRFKPSTDNGGTPITAYVVSYAPPSAVSYSSVYVNISQLIISSSNVDAFGNPTVMEYTQGNLNEGQVYRFHVAAVNSKGQSPPSPTVSIVAGSNAGIDCNGNFTYSSVSPMFQSITSSQITIVWPMPSSNSTGGTPITGYKVYMYPGVLLNTLANPRPVLNEVQMITTAVDPQLYEIQNVSFSTATSFQLSIYGLISNTTLSTSSSTTVIAALIQALLPTKFVGAPVVSQWNGYSFLVTFSNYDGPVELIVVSLPSPSAVVASVQQVQKGTSPLSGSFTLLFNGQRTIDLSFDALASDIKFALEELPEVGVVSVFKIPNLINGIDRGTNSWTVTFNSAAGNLPLMSASAGKLQPVDSNSRIFVVEVLAGSSATLVYDGTGIPDVRVFTVDSIIADMTYSFQVLPLNTIGPGVLSASTRTVLATPGASSAFTSASGSALEQSITGIVKEVQMITLKLCQNRNVTLSYNSVYMVINESWNSEVIQNMLQMHLQTGAITVGKYSDVVNTYITVTFLSSGDKSLFVGQSYSVGCNVTVEEFVRGNSNQFMIHPKVASGAVLIDNYYSDQFAGQDVFFCESYANGIWYSDQGVASYNSPLYEVQQIFFPYYLINTTNSYLSIPDYLTPQSAVIFRTPSPVYGTMSEIQMQSVIESLPNIASVNVLKSITDEGDVYFDITFLSNLCQVPLLESSNSAILIIELSIGVCDVQTITLLNDVEFVRELQQFQLSTAATNLSVSFLNSSNVIIHAPFSSTNIQQALNSLITYDGSPVDVIVVIRNTSSLTCDVEFISPVDDVPELYLLQTINGVTSPLLSNEAVKGVSPMMGTFSFSFQDKYTSDLEYNASSIQVKESIESMTRTLVSVTRKDINIGFTWVVSFVQNIGNLPLLIASPFRYAVQSVVTTGGFPTPLFGQFRIGYMNDSVVLPFDASELQMQAALESLLTLSPIEVNCITGTNGQNTWLITFLSFVGDPPLLTIDTSSLEGSHAMAIVTKVVSGCNDTLVGSNPSLSVEKKTPGRPYYSSQMYFDSPGKYETKVSLLTAGGLLGQYYDNQWFYGQSSIDRIDTQLNFDWSTGFITLISNDFVSIRWSGKIMVPKTESFTFYLSADDSAVMYLNHTTFIDGSSACCVEYRNSISLVGGVYYDLVIDYVELTGAASVSLKLQSATFKKQIAPSSLLYSGQQIVGSPYNTQVIVGAADYPYTTAYGDGLVSATSGFPAIFYIQIMDSLGNNQTIDYEISDPTEVLSIELLGTYNDMTQYFPDIVYIGQGLFQVTYYAIRAGIYLASIKMGLNDIQCGQGQSRACSPFTINVSPGPTSASTSEAESPSSQIMDYLVEAVTGQYGVFYIQAKDAFGNNKIVGGDNFLAILTLKTNPSVQYRGSIDDNLDGTYIVRYTIAIAGAYDVSVTLSGEPILTCVGAHSPFVFSRYYDGINVYNPPNFCSLNNPTLTAVHNVFNAPTSTYDDGSLQTLAFATVGVQNSFTIESRDVFGNLRRGDSTSHFSGYGDGNSDYFLIEFFKQDTSDYYRTTTAIDTISGTLPSSGLEYFKLEFNGRQSLDIPCSISDRGLEAVLETLLGFQLNVTVIKNIVEDQVSWNVIFLNMLDVWQSEASVGPSIIGKRLTIAPPTYTSFGAALGFFNSLHLSRPAAFGIYPVSFTLWQTGLYTVRISSNGIDIQGSPTSVLVRNGPVDSTSSVAFGNGLTGGVAGSSLSVFIQVKDTRQTEIQYVTTTAVIVPYVQAVQTVQISGGAQFSLGFRGASTPIITPGITTYLELKEYLVSISTLGNAESFSLFDELGSTLDNISSPISSTSIFDISFAGTKPQLFGSLPLLTSTSSSVSVASKVVGDAPFRYEVKVIVCSSNITTNVQFFTNAGSTVELNSSTSLLDVAVQLSALGYGTVNVTSIDGGSTFCSSNMFVEFTDYKGRVPTIFTTSSNVLFTDDPHFGALEGVFPLDGYFALIHDSENTSLLRYDATANEVKAALDALYSIGTVDVVKDNYGIPLSFDGMTPLYSTQPWIFSVWTIYFNGVCAGMTDGLPSPGCPASLGQESLLQVYSDNIFYTPSPYIHQNQPRIIVHESLKGYEGNNVTGFSDLSTVSMALTETSPTNDFTAQIGKYAVQRLNCVGKNGTFNIQFLNLTTTVNASSSVTSLETKLNSLSPGFLLVSLNSSSQTICGNAGTDTYIVLLSPWGQALPPIQVTNVVGIISATVYPVVDSVDSTSLVPNYPGLCVINYSPTHVGLYDVNICISGFNIATTLSSVLVTPGVEYAASSTHNISEVSVQGDVQYFSIYVRDVFGNSLASSLSSTSSFAVTLTGITDSCQPRAAVNVTAVQLDNSPYTDGIYTFSYGTGAYKMSIYSDYGASVTINGISYVNASLLSSQMVNFDVNLVAGTLNAIEITYIHHTDEAYFRVTWMGPEIITETDISSDFLYYSRNIINSPNIIRVYPGALQSESSSASGSGLSNCTALSECLFVIQASDSERNNIFNNGAQQWDIKIIGVGDWAGENGFSRISDYPPLPGVQNLSASISPLGWNYVGRGNASYGSDVILVFADITAFVFRGDTLLIGVEIIPVSFVGAYTYVNGLTTVPLERRYKGSSGTNISIYKTDQCVTGTYRLSYTPSVRGLYNIFVRTPSLNEVQIITFFSFGGLGGNYTLSVVTENSYEQIVVETTTPLSLGALYSSSAAIEQSLSALSSTFQVSVIMNYCDTIKCSYEITFMNVSLSFMPIAINAQYVVGNGVEMSVVEHQKGSRATNIKDSPFSLTVIPAATDPRYVTAF
ncbi:unnamed protein product, partial [Sphagnum balticum]